MAVACLRNLRKTKNLVRFPRFWPLTLAVACFRGLRTVFKSAKMAFNSSKLPSTRHSRAPTWPEDGTQEPQGGSKHVHDVLKKQRFASVGTQNIGLRLGIGLIIASLPPLPSLKAPRRPSEAPRWPQDGIRDKQIYRKQWMINVFEGFFPLPAAHVGWCLLWWPKDDLPKLQDGQSSKMASRRHSRTPNAPMAKNMASVPLLRATAQAGYAKRRSVNNLCCKRSGAERCCNLTGSLML